MNLKTQRVIASVLLAVVFASSGCYSWRTDSRPAATLLEQPRSQIGVIMRDGRVVVLSDARLERESIVGNRVRGNTRGPARTSLPLSGVGRIETRRFDVIRTVALIGFAALGGPYLYRLAFVEED